MLSILNSSSKTKKSTKTHSRTRLEDGQAGLAEAVKGGSGLFVLEAAAKDLHAKEGKDEDEEDQEDEQCVNGSDRVDQTLDQVTHGRPVPAITSRESKSNFSIEFCDRFCKNTFKALHLPTKL